MYKNSVVIIPYEDIDYEIVDLIKGINSVDGIETISSCFGHYKNSCKIWCKAESIEAMTAFMFNYFDCENYWRICFDLADVNKNWKDIHFYIDSMTADNPLVLFMVDNLTQRFRR